MTAVAGKVMLVTGGGSGIGRALALAFAAEGAAVAVADLLVDNAERVAAEIAAAGGKAAAFPCDVCDPAALDALKAQVEATLGPVRLLFANAGASSVERLAAISRSDLDWIVSVNFSGVVNCLHTFLPGMVAARDGHVVATSSMAGLLPGWIPDHAPYSGAKAGVIGFMVNLRAELDQAGVGCTVLCPGGVATNIAASSRYRPERFGGPTDTAIPTSEDFLEQQQFVFRPPEEVARMVMAAVRANRPMVVTDATRRQLFLDSYVDLVLGAFDDAAAFDREATRDRS